MIIKDFQPSSFSFHIEDHLLGVHVYIKDIYYAIQMKTIWKYLLFLTKDRCIVYGTYVYRAFWEVFQ